jgi:serine/threonine protein kinase/Tfp pilus assembly protein PilF
MPPSYEDDQTAAFALLTQGTQVYHYTIIKRIGVGGMGEVYLADDTRLNRQVALKFLAPKFSSDREYITRFKREAQAAARINHPNVITVYETNEYQNRSYIAMEFIHGKPLEKFINGNGMTLDQKLDISKQICEGIKAAHDCSLIHQDLKPGNIMITTSSRVIILDFGLARLIRTDTVDESGRIEGTLLYMSPEQVSGARLSYSTDIFSLGVVLYEFFTGQRPFRGKEANEVIYSILHEDPIPPSEINSNLPGYINSMLLKLLAKEPSDRFMNVDDVLDYMTAYTTPGMDRHEIHEYKARKKVVTVIDLKNLSGDDSWNYFCQGFSQDLIREISQRTDLVVSAEPEGHHSPDISEVFRRCRSDYVITGNLMHWQDKIKLGLSIYSDEGAKLLLGENFEGAAADLFAILGNAARETADVLGKASGSSSIQAEEPISTDITAYDYYLKGRNYYHTNKPEDLTFASKMFEKALELDREFALAHTGLADVHISHYMGYYDRNPKRMELAKLEAQKALRMNPRLPEAHRSLGRYYMFTGDLENAEKALLKCIEIAPKYSVGYRTLAWLKDWQGNDEGALLWAKRALELAPTDLETLLLISLKYRDMGKYTLAMATLQRAIELGPDYGRAYFTLGTVYMKLGVVELALDNFLLAIKYEGDVNSYVDAGYAYMLQKKYVQAEEKFDESIKKGFLPFSAYYYKGLMKKFEGKNNPAEVEFRKAIDAADEYFKKDPEHNVFLGYKILALAQISKKSEVLALLEECKKLCAHSGEGYHLMARVYSVLGDREKTEYYKNLALKEHAGPSKKELNLDPHFTDKNSG